MIDITTIQTYPIPQKVFLLSQANTNLKMENSRLKKNLIAAGIISGAIIVLIVLKIHNESKSREKNQFKGY